MGARAERIEWAAPDRRVRTPASARPSAKANFAVVETVDALTAIGPEWTALFERAGRPHQVFQTFAWLSIWARHYLGRGMRLSILTARVEGRLVLVWPLVVERRMGFRLLSFMGDPLSQYGDAIMEPDLPDALLNAAFDRVMAMRVDLIALRRVRDDAALAPLLRRRMGDPLSPRRAPILRFAGAATFAAFEARYSAKTRSTRRRLRRRMEDDGPLAAEQHGPSPRARELVATAMAYKRQWACRTGTLAPSIRDPRFEAFFLDAATPGPDRPALRVFALRRGDDVVGIEMSVACKGHLYGHVLAPKPGLEKQGAGLVLVAEAIANAQAQGIDAYDMLAPADSYKLDWTHESVGVGDHAMALGLRGMLYERVWLRWGRALAKAVATDLLPRLLRRSRRPRG